MSNLTTIGDYLIKKESHDALKRAVCTVGALQRRAERGAARSARRTHDAAEQFGELCARFGKADFFCFIDTSDNAAPDTPQLLRMGDTLKPLLPCPSRFEH